MDFIAGCSTLVGQYQRGRILSLSPLSKPRISGRTTILARGMGTRAESEAEAAELGGENAYDILGVSETSSLDEIKASFRKLAKESHPDLAASVTEDDSDTSTRFIQLVAAYEILSDPTRRAHYDHYLLSQRVLLQKDFRVGSSYQMYSPYMTTTRQMEVVEWLRWYRYAVKDILSERRIVSGTGYFDVLQRDFYSAIHAAYYGPETEIADLLPDRFEAEERSCETPEVLHLVSGRDLFGVVRLADNVLELSDVCCEKLTYSSSVDLDSGHLVDDPAGQRDYPKIETVQTSQMGSEDSKQCISDAYKNLELYLCGRLIATATRVDPESSSDGTQNENSQDQIHIFLNLEVEPRYASQDSGTSSKALLGTITGLGTNPEESSCFVYNDHGTKTHVILKHRTLLVKHMHWFQFGGDISICECRCTRARLPPSKNQESEERNIGGLVHQPPYDLVIPKRKNEGYNKHTLFLHWIKNRVYVVSSS